MSFVKSAALFFLLEFLFGSCGPAQTSPKILGEPAPNFTLPRLEGGQAELTALVKEKPALLVFWATWCPSCVEEIPVLNEWIEKYPGLQIVGINVGEPAEHVRKFTEKRQIRYPILLDEKGDVAGQYGLVGIPAALFIAKGGRVIYYGFSLPENIEELIKA